jgi:hypothetical protein
MYIYIYDVKFLALLGASYICISRLRVKHVTDKGREKMVVAALVKLHVWLRNVVEIGKAIPLQAWADPEGARSLRLPDFKTIST